MLTSRFQLGLIATLAVGLGFSLASSEAVGYPAGAAVSLGTNPVFSTGGVIDSTTTPVTMVTAPGDQAVVITDVIMSFESNSCSSHLVFTNGAGENVADFRLKNTAYSVTRGTYFWRDSIAHSFQGGMRVEPGDTLSAVGECNPSYTLSGYYAQP